MQARASSATLPGLRAWLDSRLFPAAPATAPRSAAALVLVIGLGVAGVALVLLRSGGAPLDSIWAEDGFIFYGGALVEPFPEPLLTGFNGYMCLVPRLLAEPATLLPVEWAAATLAIEGAIVAVVAAFATYVASAGHLPDRRLRGVMAAAVVLVPVVGQQTLANVSYLQWVLFLPTFWLLLWRPTTPRTAAAAAVFLALSLATTPLALLLAPLAVARLLATRTRLDSILLSGFALGAIAQILTILTSDTPADYGDWRADVPEAYLVRVVGGTLLGHPANAAAWEGVGQALTIAAALALGALIAVAVTRGHRGRAVSLIAIGLSIAMFALGFQRDPYGLLIWPEGQSNMDSARYTVVPALLLVAAILVQLQHAPSRLSAVAWRATRIGVVAVLALAAASSFYVGDDKRSVQWSDQLASARATCRADAAPAEVQIPISPYGWVVVMPCSELRG